MRKGRSGHLGKGDGKGDVTPLPLPFRYTGIFTVLLGGSVFQDI